MFIVDFGETFSSPNYEVRDSSGALANAGTVTASITLPDATTTAPTVNNPSTGIYNFDYTPTGPGIQAGRHNGYVTATGGILGSLIRKFPIVFRVLEADPGLIIGLTEGKAHLNEQGSLQDEEILFFLEVSTRVIESIVGPCVIRTYTQQVDTDNGTSLLLSHFPVISVTSLVPVYSDGVTYATADLVVDTAAGIVRTATRGGTLAGGPWTATYKAGRAVIPANYVQAAKEMLWHLWATQRGQLADSTTPDLLDVATFEGSIPFGSVLPYSIPNRVRELLQADHMPSFA